MTAKKRKKNLKMCSLMINGANYKRKLTAYLALLYDCYLMELAGYTPQEIKQYYNLHKINMGEKL